MNCTLRGCYFRCPGCYTVFNLYIISANYVVNCLSSQKYMSVQRTHRFYTQDKNTSGWHEWKSAAIALEIRSCHHRKWCESQRSLWSLLFPLLFQEFVAHLWYSIFTHILSLSSFCSYFLPPLIWMAQSAALQSKANTEVRCDNGVWHCFLFPSGSVWITAVSFYLLKLAFAQVTAPAM